MTCLENEFALWPTFLAASVQIAAINRHIVNFSVSTIIRDRYSCCVKLGLTGSWIRKNSACTQVRYGLECCGGVLYPIEFVATYKRYRRSCIRQARRVVAGIVVA